MDYKERYNAALERAKERYSACSAPALLEYIFPELKESEDGKNKRISKEITQFLKQNNGWNREWLAWLEKQGEPEDKGEISDGYHTFNELYRYRMLYNAAFFNLLPKELVHKSKKHHDGKECFGGGWFIVMANLPTGQISNHYELKDWDLFQIPEKDFADEWDGHTPQEAADRLHKYLLEKQGEHKPYGQRKECEDCQFNYAGKCEGLCQMKRDEQNPADEVEPKFKVGDWVVLPLGIIAHIESLNSTDYQVTTTDGKICDFKISKQDNYHLWSIADAKDGDVLVCESGWTCIFKTLVNDENFSSYCFMDDTKWFCETGSECHTLNKEFMKAYNGEIKPATKEQRDALMKAMADAGWEFDFEKKELKKKLDADKVIEWLKTNVYDDSAYGKAMIEQFKKDFGL